MTQIRIGIAGYMGSGKSTFAKYLSQKGAVIYEADIIAKEIMNTSPAIKNQLAEKFGDSILLNDKIQFKLLGKSCFSSKSNLAALNTIVHKPLVEHLHNLIKNNRQKICILDAALISLWQIENWFDILFWVQASKEVRMKRLAQKIAIPTNELEKRVGQQEVLFNEPSEKEWTIISNEGSCEEFKEAMRNSYNTIDKYLTC